MSDVLENELEGINENILNIFKELIEYRDFLHKDIEAKSTEIKRLENLCYTCSKLSSYNLSGFIKEVQKKQKYCQDNTIESVIFLIKLENYETLRKSFGVKGAEVSLYDLATQIKSIAKDNDVLGYIFSYTFGFFVPFMSEEEALIFANQLERKFNFSYHLFKGQKVPIKTSIVHKKLGNEDLEDFLYKLDLLFNNRV